ncbi:MAG: hypothetical protein FWF36_10220, partial [Propionibacteriaceae bacterium]|nr:hypothetical protein [Propionibacteriaceae bacterium]
MSLIGIGGLKRAAIDAFMRDLNMWNPGSYGQWADPGNDCLGYVGRFEDGYHLGDTLGRTVTVKRPDEDGVGGGELLSVITPPTRGREGPIPDFAAIFEDIRGMIDQTLSPLKDLPEPYGFDDLEKALGPACEALITSKVSVSPGRGLSDPIKMIGAFLDDYQSAFLKAFAAKFLTRMEDAVAVYFSIGMALGAALGGEYGLWQKTDEVTNKAIKQAAHAFTDHSNQALSTWAEDLSIIGVMGSGIAVFVAAASLAMPPVEVGALALLAVGLTFVTDAGDAALQASQPGPSFASIMQSFQDSITAIIADTFTQEQLLDDNLLEWCRSCSDGHMNLNNQLAGEPIDSPASWPSIDLDLKRCRDVYTIYLPQIKDGLASART